MKREHVGYEICQSHILGKGIVGVKIHGLKDRLGNTDYAGKNPLDNWTTTEGGLKKPLSTIYSSYDYATQDGYNKLGDWIEAAAKKAKR